MNESKILIQKCFDKIYYNILPSNSRVFHRFWDWPIQCWLRSKDFIKYCNIDDFFPFATCDELVAKMAASLVEFFDRTTSKVNIFGTKFKAR